MLKKLPGYEDEFVAGAAIRCRKIHIINSISTIICRERLQKIVEIFRFTLYIPHNDASINFVCGKLCWNSMQFDLVELIDYIIRNGNSCIGLKKKIYQEVNRFVPSLLLSLETLQKKKDQPYSVYLERTSD